MNEIKEPVPELPVAKMAEIQNEIDGLCAQLGALSHNRRVTDRERARRSEAERRADADIDARLEEIGLRLEQLAHAKAELLK